jgi:hypothetical protein
MTQAWVVLTALDGREINSPTEKQLTAALTDLFNLHKQKEYVDTVSATLSFGYDDGLMYVLEVNSDGGVSFEEWSDRDCEIALASPRSMVATQAQALQLWLWLAHRQVAKIRGQSWHTD